MIIHYLLCDREYLVGKVRKQYKDTQRTLLILKHVGPAGFESEWLYLEQGRRENEEDVDGEDLLDLLIQHQRGRESFQHSP